MGPTCSIIFENEPMEKNSMIQKPRPFVSSFFNWNELMTSIIQGLAITVGTLLIYQYAVYIGLDEAQTRAMVFAVLIVSNIFLTLVNRSFYYSIFTTLKYKNNLVAMIIGITIMISALLLYVPSFANFFEFGKLSISNLLVASLIGFIAVILFEFIKLRTRLKSK